MKVAICGYPPLALQVQNNLRNIEFKFFIHDFISTREGDNNFVTDLPLINFFEFRRLVNAGELDGVIIAEDCRQTFTKNVVRICKLYSVPKVGVMDFIMQNPFLPVHWLDKNKAHIPYLETNLVDGCNLNCKGCTHFAGLFKRDEIYPLENFRNDIRQLSKVCDVSTFRLLGGEPLLLKNLDEYIKIARQCFPKTSLHITTNGLLIPSLPQKILDAMRESNCRVDVTGYKPTLKVFDKIANVLQSNRIAYAKITFGNSDEINFHVFLTLNHDNDPVKSRNACFNAVCRFLRNGKIYKCPIYALNYRFAEYFGIENYPKATGVDLYAQNFSSLLPMLDGNVEMCNYCGERSRFIPWEPSNNPRLEDWLADPDELKNFS